MGKRVLRRGKKDGPLKDDDDDEEESEVETFAAVLGVFVLFPFFHDGLTIRWFLRERFGVPNQMGSQGATKSFHEFPRHIILKPEDMI